MLSGVSLRWYLPSSVVGGFSVVDDDGDVEVVAGASRGCSNETRRVVWSSIDAACFGDAASMPGLSTSILALLWSFSGDGVNVAVCGSVDGGGERLTKVDRGLEEKQRVWVFTLE